MFEYTDPSLQGEVYSNNNSGVLELKRHKVHFADKFSGAALEKCTECSYNPNVNKEVAKYPDAELAWRGVLSLPPC